MKDSKAVGRRDVEENERETWLGGCGERCVMVKTAQGLY
jgi:hypothetical protein